VLEAASVQDLKRLLDLFPNANLREKWPKPKGTKEEICFAVAEERNYRDLAAFVDETFSCCKQHVYIFTRGPDTMAFPEAVPEGAKILEAGEDHALYIARVKYGVVLKDPLEETSIDFLWPIRIELRPQHLVLRFVSLEKNVGSYFDRQCYVDNRNVDEKSIVQALEEVLAMKRTDIHKGIKKLWEDGFMDSPRAKFKKAISMASEAMDEERGIREYNRELYETMQGSVLLNTVFYIPEEKSSVSAFMVDCSTGYLAFPRYSEKKGDTDSVIGEILRHNQ
jgi:hypothetical protein